MRLKPNLKFSCAKVIILIISLLTCIKAIVGVSNKCLSIYLIAFFFSSASLSLINLVVNFSNGTTNGKAANMKMML